MRGSLFFVFVELKALVYSDREVWNDRWSVGSRYVGAYCMVGRVDCVIEFAV